MIRIILILILPIILISCSSKNIENQKPNIVLVFMDDGSYTDYKPFGNPPYPTPNVEKLASQGTRYNNFYVPQAVCSASRAALLSGCYPGRTKVFGAHGPHQPSLDTSYATIAEVLKANGYATAVFGKWHLGDVEGQRPHDRGFDESSGLMYSNDMWKHHPRDPEYWSQWPLQYWKNGQVTIDEVDHKEQEMLTTWYTEGAVDFINRHKDSPFFVYLAHSMPHVPLYCSEKFKDKSGAGLYGDVMMELDWSVGEVMKALKENGLEENTMLVFIGSDNGPWLEYGNHAGITPYREGKGTSFDGGIRNPCIIRYPGKIEASVVSTKAFSSLDILPTICAITGADLPTNEIDGKNVWDIMANKPNATNPNDYYPISVGSHFQGIITADGQWKLLLPHEYRTLDIPGVDGMNGKYRMIPLDTSLFNLHRDELESTNVLSDYPEMADSLIRLALQHKSKFYN